MGRIMKASSSKEIFWQVVSSVPAGYVATYGQIARIAGFPDHSRYVGAILKQLPKDTKLPWHRIINSKGGIAFPEGSTGYKRQVALLKREGVELTGNRVSLKVFQWKNQSS